MKNKKLIEYKIESNADLTELIDGIEMFDNCKILISFNSSLPKLVNGYRMFNNCKNLESFSSELSNLIIGIDMFYNTKLKTFNSDLSKLINGEYMFCYCNNLETFNSSLSKLENGTNMFDSCKLDASEINKILTSLPAWNDGRYHHISFLGCPGAKTCDTSIGTKKGWKVEVEPLSSVI